MTGSWGSTEMNQRVLRLLQLMVRLAAILNLAEFALEASIPRLARAVTNGPIGGAAAVWMVLSSFLLPVCVGLEAVWMQKRGMETTSLRIDAVLAVSWFIVFWISLLYTA